MKSLYVAFVLFGAAPLLPQTVPTTAASSVQISNMPVAFLASGTSYNTTTPQPYGAGFVSIGIQIGGVSSRTYAITSMDFTRTTSSVRTGVGYALLQFNGITVTAYADGGITTTAGAALGSLAGGGYIFYDLGRLAKPLQKSFILVGVREVAVTSTVTKPVYQFGFGRSF